MPNAIYDNCISKSAIHTCKLCQNFKALEQAEIAQHDRHTLEESEFDLKSLLCSCPSAQIYRLCFCSHL